MPRTILPDIDSLSGRDKGDTNGGQMRDDTVRKVAERAAETTAGHPEGSPYTADKLDEMAQQYSAEQKQNYCKRQKKHCDRIS